MNNQQALILTEDDINQCQYPTLLEKNNLKNISCVVFPINDSNPAFIKFWDGFIYEFKIDFYKTGKFAGDGFFDYCKVQYDSENNNYKIYSYYPDKGKLNPTKLTRDDKYYIIELLSTDDGIIKFKGPIFTSKYSHRFGEYDEWILNTKIRFLCE